MTIGLEKNNLVREYIKQNQPVTLKNVTEALGLSDTSARQHINHLKNSRHCVYVSGWHEVRRHLYLPFFSFGNEPDKAKPIYVPDRAAGFGKSSGITVEGPLLTRFAGGINPWTKEPQEAACKNNS